MMKEPIARRRTEKRVNGNMSIFSKIAWQGWEIPVEPEWRPLKIEGGRDDGSMMIGLPQTPVLQLKWRRLRGRALDAASWLMQRFKIERPDGGAPLPRGFGSSAWKLRHALKKGGHLSIWMGVGEKENCVLELLSTSLAPREVEEKIFRDFLPCAVLRGPGEEWSWTMNGVAFSAPGDFRLAREHLYSGDIALEFTGPKKEILHLRQVYPGSLALSRRNMRRWLEMYPFAERRRRVFGSEEKWSDASGRFAGIRVSSRRLIPFPFNWVGPQTTSSIAVHDGDSDRLLIAEFSADSKRHSPELAEKSIIGMN